MPKEEMHIVTEVGTFGGLTINDPTQKKVPTQQELEELIKESTAANLANLTK